MADPFTRAQFIAIFPEFAAKTVDDVSAVQNFMMDEVSQPVFGASYVKALMLMTAHFFLVSKRRGAGPVTAERVGDVSVSFAAFKNDRALEQTAYGIQFLKLLRQKVGGPHFAGQSYPPSLLNVNAPLTQ